MRTPAILLLTMIGALVVGSGVALAAVISCPTGPDGECRGTNLTDQISGAMGVDQIYALGGDDSVRGGGGADLIKGNLGADSIKGDSGADAMYGGDCDNKMGTCVGRRLSMNNLGRVGLGGVLLD